MNFAIQFSEPNLLDVERFTEKIYIPNSIWDCWLWTGALTERKYGQGYGKFRVEGKSVYAHRYSYFLANCSNPAGVVDHLCNDSSCVNPIHLKDETWARNSARTKWAISPVCRNGHLKAEHSNGKRCLACSRDLDAKRYQQRYEDEKQLATNSSEMRDFAHNPKLTAEEVVEIRQLYTKGSSQRQLAREFKVSQPMIGMIVRRETWKTAEQDCDFRKVNSISHCKHGHEYTEANTRINKKGARECRECMNVRNAQRAEYKKQWKQDRKG